MRLYFEDDPRVHVFDNASKFIWWQWGKNLVVTHHGDRIKMSNLHGSIVSNLRKEWGEAEHTFVWTGHIHHKNQEEYGGALFEVLEHPSTRRRLARFLWLCQFSEYDMRDSSQRLRGRRQIKGERGAD
jgi:hypothetical protein